jgi:hypothetical protein
MPQQRYVAEGRSCFELIGPHRPSVSNGRSDAGFIIRGSFHGRFLDHGSKAKRWVEVDNGGC